MDTTQSASPEYSGRILADTVRPTAPSGSPQGDHPTRMRLPDRNLEGRLSRVPELARSATENLNAAALEVTDIAWSREVGAWRRANMAHARTDGTRP
jgi:hypothetical protein